MVSQDLLISEYQALVKIYPKLTPPYLQGETWVIQGEYDFFDNTGIFIDSFFIEIQIPLNYPNKLPTIIERSKKIPEDINWHNSARGCCLSPDAVIYHRLGTVQLDRWFKIFVESFFANFLYKKSYKEYPEGEFEHGDQGILDGYKQILSLSTGEEVEQYLNNILNPKLMGRNEKCFCNSGKKFKNCWLIDSSSHINQLKVPKEQLKLDLIAITEHIKLEKNIA